MIQRDHIVDLPLRVTIQAGSSLCSEVSLVMDDNINQISSAAVPDILHCHCWEGGTPIAKVIFVGSGGIDGMLILPAAGRHIPLQQIQRFRWQRLWDHVGMNGGEGDLRFAGSKKTPIEYCHGGEGEVRCGHQKPMRAHTWKCDGWYSRAMGEYDNISRGTDIVS